MNKQEAKQLVLEELARWRQKPYAELSSHIGESHHIDVTGASGCRYQLEIEIFWDATPGENIHVLGAIDDGGWSAFSPLTDSFIVSKTGQFIGE
jgi:hypothetical protein